MKTIKPSGHIDITKSWIEQFVIAYHLCPFASKPFREDRIRYVLLEEENEDKLHDLMMEEVKILQSQPSEVVETTLIIHPNIGRTFDSYLDIFAALEKQLEMQKLEEFVQLASFHPDYQFAETDYDHPENFTNRSPYPMIHLLRVDSVEASIESYPDTMRIPTNNIARMRQIGTTELVKIYHEIIRKN